ncbi:YqeG family HAD IIIA-type phosphatase [Nodosilinea sp. LEGE 07088]|uniref:YqeG family HAD IIIA-type phosphatase n=1 Tax=Nodosilinea sp. LEGE 07088 TaxID=2777968 RepID=UPI00187F99D0|nr:YqeG family HAD IIIA-type phosphatase [Nodosilinea sp. LEGE 07088]MBE9136855.1 YqeG family HAD IIIA-type phosphatase [Nodosilinea sp. LEGE 07088]
MDRIKRFRKSTKASNNPIFFEKRAVRKTNSGLPRQIPRLALISIEELLKSKIQGVIIDLDNTIISEDDLYLSPDVEYWIEKAKALGIRFYILSNGKRKYRVQYWSEYLNIPAISPARKPFPKAFRFALDNMRLSPDQVVVVGDSRHTDILGAWILGCPSIQVASLPHPPRWWEKLLGKYLQTPYPKDMLLWDFLPPKSYK